MAGSVLLDTSFFIRLLRDSDRLYRNANDYLRYLSEQKMPTAISTISIAEFCVAGNINDLPLKTLQILPFNMNHAERAGEFAKEIFQNRRQLNLIDRNIIPNDMNLFVQADSEESIEYYLTSDEESLRMYNLLKTRTHVRFQFINLMTPPKDAFPRLF
jgi:predicted nucleic acid-binding protein